MGGTALASLAAVIALTTTIADAGQAEGGRVVAYPAPAGQPLNSSFSVKVRPAGGDWQQLDVYGATVDRDTRSLASMVLFDAEGPVEVEVTKTGGVMGSARIRPYSSGIAPTLSADGKTATFLLTAPLNVSFEADGDILRNLHVFASVLEQDVPQAGPGVIVFGPGIHPIPGDHVLTVPSNTTLYIAGGAVVQGSIDIVGARNVVVRGRGIVDPSRFFGALSRPTIDVRSSTDVGIRDITILRGQDGAIRIAAAARVVVSGIREINPDRSSDGIYVNSSQDVLVDGVFMRTSDDSFAVYASTEPVHGDTHNITMRNSTLWADRAHGFLSGTHGDPETRDVVEHVELQNIDILEHDSSGIYQGALAVNAGNRVTVRDVRFEDIRIDDFTSGQVVNLVVFRNSFYNTKHGLTVDRVLLRNVAYTGTGDRPSEIRGYDQIRRVKNVVFENFVRNGRVALGSAAANIVVGPYASNIVFRRQQPARTVPGASAAIRYAGRWQRTPAAGSHAGDLHAPLGHGSRLTYSFTGRQARVYGRTGPAAGKVDVAVDGRKIATVDTFSAVPRARQVWFDTGVLPSGPHRIELRYRRARNVLASGAAVGFDRLEIVK